MTLALGLASAAAAKAPIRASNAQVKVQAKPLVIAHTAGHKIA